MVEEQNLPEDGNTNNEKLVNDNYTDKIIREESALVDYMPISRNIEKLELKVPKSIAYETAYSLQILQKNHGEIDKYVANKLKYDSVSQLYAVLKAEQIDAVGLAIYNLEKKSGIICGDMTGVGKGRVAASIARYAIVNGKVPVFITAGTNLMTDFWRDLKDTENKSFLPFIIASDSQAAIMHEDEETGEVSVEKLTKMVKGRGDKMIKKTFFLQPLPKSAQYDALAGKDTLPDGYDLIMTTYSQFMVDEEAKESKRKKVRSKAEKKPTANVSQFRYDFLKRIAPNAIFILDESHQAGGGTSNVGIFFRNVLEKSDGCLYLSATFAKDPSTMPLYAVKTAMKDEGLRMDLLISAIKSGGLPMQEVITADLVTAGQYIRRERPFSCCQDTKAENPERREQQFAQYDSVINLVREVISFQKTHINPTIIAMEAAARQKAKYDATDADDENAWRNVKRRNIQYSQRLFNIVDQLLFSIKAESVAQEVIKIIKANGKPIVAFKSTMETFLDDMGLRSGDYIDSLDFALVFRHAMKAVMKYVATDEKNKKDHKILMPDELDEDGREEYERLSSLIMNMRTGLHISPIDYMTSIIEKAGYKVGEVTGRKQRIILDEKNPLKGKVMSHSANKNLLFGRFNNDNGVTVLFINQSGATGASLHSDRRFKDQRQRVMVFHQNELNINLQIQKMGRVFRTNQANCPDYRKMPSNVPAERRLMMMLQAKLNSLNANTTASSEGTYQWDTDLDLLNKYGSKVIYDYMLANPEFVSRIYDPFKMQEADSGGTNEEREKARKLKIAKIEKAAEGEELASTVTRAVACLPCVEQEVFYNQIISDYQDHINLIIANEGGIDLKMNVRKYAATTKQQKILLMGTHKPSPFGRDAIREDCEVNILKKPMKFREIKDLKDDFLQGRTSQDYYDEIMYKYMEFLPSWRESYLEIAKRDLAAQNELKKAQEEMLNSEEDKEKREAIIKKIGKINLKIAELENSLSTKETYLRIAEQGVKFAFDFYRVGNPIAVPETEDSDNYSKGILYALSIDYSKVNPYAPNAIKLQIAVLDGRRKLEIPLSQTKFVSKIHVLTGLMSDEEKWNALNNWDSFIPTRLRENKLIVTGNLLLANALLESGRLVKYTTDNNIIKTGIVFPSKQEEKYATSGTVVPLSSMFEYMLNSNVGDLKIETTEKEMNFRKTSYDRVIVIVSGFKSYGAIYYNDDSIFRFLVLKTDEAGKQMYWKTEKKEMRAEVLLTKLQAFLEYVTEKFQLTVTMDKGIPVSTGDEGEENKEYFYSIVDSDSAKTIPMNIFIRSEDDGTEFGAVVLRSQLNTLDKLRYGIIPIFPDARASIQEWYDNLGDAQKQELSLYVKNYKDNPSQPFKLKNYIFTTNVYDTNYEYTFGNKSKDVLFDAFLQLFNASPAVSDEQLLRISIDKLKIALQRN